MVKGLFAIIAVVMIFLVSLSASSDAAERSFLKIGDTPPKISLPDLSGNAMVIPDDLKGKVVILRFWADWCTPCIEEMPALESLYARHRGKGLVVVAVNVGQTRERVNSFVRRTGITYEVLLDPNMKTARKYGVIGLPRTFILDKQGRIKYKLTGDASHDTVKRLVHNLL